MANTIKKIKKTEIYAIMKAEPDRFYKAMPADWKSLFPVITTAILEKMGLHFTVNHNGKMSGMVSLSTTCKCNQICRDRIAAAFRNAGIEYDGTAKGARAALKKYMARNPLATDVSICGFCFSDSQQDYMAGMTEPLTRNYEILNGGIIHKDWLPTLNALYARGESFGDFASVNAVVNFYNLAKVNPAVNFTAWTKNITFFIKAAEMGYKKPRNFKLVLSSIFVNRPAIVPEKALDIVDAVFTVYTPEFAAANNITINCGARACLACLRCYKDYKKGQIKEVNELLK